jgi:O-antigen/teichoic acid export membrane protein
MFYFKTIILRIMGIEEVQRQSIVSLIWQIANTALGFLGTMYFAHAVGASVLGAYFLFVTYLGFFGMLSDGGIGGAAIKRISEGKEQDAYFSAFFLLRFLLVIAVVFALFVFRRYFVDLDNAGLFIWLIMALLISQFSGPVSAGIAGCGKMGIYATSDFIYKLLRTFMQIAAVFLGLGAAGLAGGYILPILVVAVFELRFFNLHFTRFSREHLKSLGTFSFWLFLTSTGVLLYSSSDTIMIGYYMDNADVGVYRVVMQFTTIAAFTTVALRQTLWPKVSRWGKAGEYGLIEEALSRAFSYSLILAVPVFAGGVLLGRHLLYFFYGAEFASGYLPLVILLAVQVINVFQFLFTMYLSALDRQKDAFKVTAVAASANIVINLLLIPVMGITGAAIATLVTMILNAILAGRVLSKIITIQIEHGSLLNILKASAAMSLFVGIYRVVVPLSNVWFTLVPVVMGGIMYSVLILKFDWKICEELKGIMVKVGMPWPEWL